MAGIRTPSERDEEQCEGNSDGSGGAVTVVNDEAPRLPLEALLTEAQACPESRSWAVPYGTDYERAWDECPNAEWLLYMARVCGVDAGTIAKGTIRAVGVLEDALCSHSMLDVRHWLHEAFEAAKIQERTVLLAMGRKLFVAFAAGAEEKWSDRVMLRLAQTLRYISAPACMKLEWRVNPSLNAIFEDLLIGEGPDTYRRIANAVREEISFTQVMEAYRASSAANP